MASLTYFQQSEVVRQKKFPEWRVQKYGVLMDFMEKGEVQKIGERGFIIPVEKTLGGDPGLYDPQMGDMGRGSMPEGLTMSQSYMNFRINWEFDKLSLKATANKNVAIESPFLKCIAKGFQEFRLIRDKWYHGDGTAVQAIATAHSSGSGVSVYTLDGVYGAQRLRRGNKVTVYDTSLATVKSAGVLRITDLNTGAPSVTLSGIVPGAAATDKLCFDGVSGASPAGPRGLEYWVSSATSGLTAGVNRATENQLISKSVDAASAPYNPLMVMGLYDKILNDRGEAAQDLMAICAPVQRAAVYANLYAIQNILLDSTSAKAVDRLPALKGRDTFMHGNVPHMVDIHCNKTKVFFVISKMWGRAVLAEEDFFQTDGVSGPAGRFIQLYGASGGPAAGTWMGLTCDENPYCIDPGAQGLIHTLPLAQYHT